MKNFRNVIINENQTILAALQMLNNIPQYLTLFVENSEKKIIGSLTDGDIRRGLLAGYKITDPVSKVMFRNFRFLLKGKFTLNEVQEIKEKKIKLVPIINNKYEIIKLIDLNKCITILPLEAIIMAGGRGERLRPLTDKTPKSLLKVGDKPILEINIDRLIKYGIDEFFITVKYKKEQIIKYFGDGSQKNIKIHYVEESLPLGTIGSVNLIKGLQHEDILVMNSDLLTNIDFEDFYKKYLEEKADMAVASIPYQIDLPYAVLETNKGRIKSFKEKPTFTYYSNAGIYIIRRKLLKLIPVKQHFNATDFMAELLKRNYKLIYYPILGYWLDIGRHEDYKKANEDIHHIKL